MITTKDLQSWCVHRNRKGHCDVRLVRWNRMAGINGKFICERSQRREYSGARHDNRIAGFTHFSQRKLLVNAFVVRDPLIHNRVHYGVC